MFVCLQMYAYELFYNVRNFDILETGWSKLWSSSL
jgi:hypothetical protein